MVDRTLAAVQALQDPAQVGEHDEVDQVLTILRILKKQVTSPVVQECLKAACFDIAHLAGSVGTDGGNEEGDIDDRGRPWNGTREA